MSILDEFKASYPENREDGGFTPPPRTRYRSGEITKSLGEQATEFKDKLTTGLKYLQTTELTPEAQAQQDELIRNPFKAALNTFKDIPEQQAQLEEQGGQALHDVTGGRAPKWVGSLMVGMVDQTTPPGGRGAISAVKNTLRSQATKNLAKKFLTKLDWKKEAKRLHVEEGLPMPEVRKIIGKKWIDPKSNETYSIHTKKRGKDVDLVSDAVRKIRAAKRKFSEEIRPELVQEYAEEFGQSQEVVDNFMKYQKDGKRQIMDLLDKINTRIGRDNPELLNKYKASLGHGKAAKRYIPSGGGADIISNLDKEDHVTNITRSNKDEISDAFNRALGRSTNVREEFMKFIDPDVGGFHKGFRLGRHQKDKIIEYVSDGMQVDFDWQSVLSDSGKQLYSSKEEFLINEALQQFVK